MDTPDDGRTTRPGAALNAAWSAIERQQRAEAAEQQAFDLAMAPARELMKATLRVTALQAAATMWAPSLRGTSVREDRVLETADVFLDWLSQEQVSGGQDSPTNVGRAPAAQGEEDPTSSAPLEEEVGRILDLQEGDHVQDRQGLVWKVIRDGGMVERPNHTETCPQAIYPGSRHDEDACDCPGVATAGTAWLQRTTGPLVKLR